MYRLASIAFACAGYAVLLSPHLLCAQKYRTADYVRVAFKASEPDENGMQSLTILLDIEKGYYLHANPAGAEEFDGAKTEVILAVAGKPADAEIRYPAGAAMRSVLGDYYIYEGNVAITCFVKREPNDRRPLYVSVFMVGLPLKRTH